MKFAYLRHHLTKTYDISLSLIFVMIILFMVSVVSCTYSGTASAQSTVPAMERIARELRNLNQTLKGKNVKCECLCSCPSSSAP